MARALGGDYSQWQDNNSTAQPVNFNTAKTAGMTFVFIKASQQYADADFLLNWANAKKAGLFRGAYHYLDWTVSEITQAKLFVSLLANDPGELPPMIDFEMKAGVPDKRTCEAKLWSFANYVEKALNKVPGIYTGYYYWQEHTNMGASWARHPLWLAWYAEESVIKVPLPWGAWRFWQYTSTGDGAKYGAESQSVDLDYFNGTEAELEAYAGSSIPIPPTPTTLLYYVNSAVLNVRSTPTSVTNTNIIGQLNKYAQIAVDSVQNYWAHFIPQTGFTSGGWVYKTYITPVGITKVCPTCGGTGKIPV